MASSSSSGESASLGPKWIYDVFLSFSGEDVRTNFVDHLYTALEQKAIFTFKDDERLERGKSIEPELLKAIEESRFSIVIFSKKYASSSWCLKELAKIIERKNVTGLEVLPVFYDVDPSDVRKQTGDFGEAFAKHGESDKVEIWRAALVEAANSSGWDLRKTADGHESKCIQEIVGVILSKLDDTVSSDVENLVGIEPRIAEVNALLGIGTDDIRIIGIWGLSGIGKTTIARVIFDRISNQFDAGSFLHEVREASVKHSLEHLQEKMLSEILILKNLKINDVYNGKKMIMRRLRYKRVLVVLDDVDSLAQLDALTGNPNWFGSGSRIIITTRNQRLLIEHEVDKIHEMSLLNNAEAIQLFSWKAFKKICPIKDYEDLSRLVVHYAGGLPLALRVLGSALYGRDVTEWRSTLDRLEKEGPEGEILEKLKIGYDGLKNTEKEIFLDIACFFKGKKTDSVTRMLDSFGFFPAIGICALIERSLISLSQNRFRMHQLIQEMGWYIVRQNSPQELGKRSRLWLADDVIHVLTRSTGKKEVQGILLDLSEPKDVNIRTDAFRKMNNLRLLKIHNAYVPQGPEYLPDELQWINWYGFPSTSMPQSFQAGKLVGLKMCHSRMVQLWKANKPLGKLKYINLSHSQKLIRTPEFTEVPNLERLNLEGCTSLVEVHPSIAILKRLVFISLKDCENLRSFSNSIQLDSLEIFNLSGCLKLGKFPEIPENMEHLLEVYLEGTAIKELPSSIEHLPNLVLMNLSHCKNLTSLPSTICALKRLKRLVLSGCSKLEQLPEDLGKLECLEELHGDGTAVTKPPPSIVLLKNLKVLSFRGCKGMPSQSWTTLALSLFLPRKRQDSVSLVLPSLSGLCSLAKLDISNCNLLDGAIPNDLGCLSSLDELNLGGNNFVNIPAESINKLSGLKILELVGCKMLESLPELPSSIEELYADGCTSLRGYEDILTKNRNLYSISISNCAQLLDDQRSRKFSSTLWQHLLQGLSVVDDQFGVYIPGRDIPEWFSYQNTGSSISMKLSPHWFNDKFMGFALCAVSEMINPIPFSCSNIYLQKIPRFEVCFSFLTQDNKKLSGFVATICNLGADTVVDSEHLCLAYIPFYKIWSLCKRKVESLNDLCEVKFFLLRYREPVCVVNKWGIRLVYKEDIKRKDEMSMTQYSSLHGNLWDRGNYIFLQHC